MPSHFSTIGMPVESAEDLEQLCERAAEDAEEISCPAGRYIRWSSAQGAELWMQVDNSNELVGVTPYFHARSEFVVGITTEINRPDETALEGAVHGWAEPQEDDPESGICPVVFDLVDKGWYQPFAFPFVSKVRLSAFAHDLDLHDSEEAYFAAQDGEMKFAAESFIPSGLFSFDEEDPGQPQSIALFSGHILEADRLSNPLTGFDYFRFCVQTLGGTIDVLADPELVGKQPIVGGVLSGTFWLCGRILEPKYAAKKGVLYRLFGRESAGVAGREA